MSATLKYPVVYLDDVDEKPLHWLTSKDKSPDLREILPSFIILNNGLEKVAVLTPVGNFTTCSRAIRIRRIGEDSYEAVVVREDTVAGTDEVEQAYMILRSQNLPMPVADVNETRKIVYPVLGYYMNCKDDPNTFFYNVIYMCPISRRG